MKRFVDDYLSSTLMHLADVFIQSILHWIEGVVLLKIESKLLMTFKSVISLSSHIQCVNI